MESYSTEVGRCDSDGFLLASDSTLLRKPQATLAQTQSLRIRRRANLKEEPK
jgi:hypothetical protein